MPAGETARAGDAPAREAAQGFAPASTPTLPEDAPQAFADAQRAARASFPLTAGQMAQVAAGRHGAALQQALANASVGVIGLGGLGSNAAVHLARLGVGRLVLVDFDRVEPSNLNRQHYFARHLGRSKAFALSEQLLDLNPHLTFEPHVERVDAGNVVRLFDGCQVVIEAVDDPQQKAQVTEAMLMQLPETTLVGASGMAGVGAGNAIRTARRFDRYLVCGDGVSDVEQEGFLAAPRVALAAAHQALAALRVLAGLDGAGDAGEPGIAGEPGEQDEAG